MKELNEEIIKEMMEEKLKTFNVIESQMKEMEKEAFRLQGEYRLLETFLKEDEGEKEVDS